RRRTAADEARGAAGESRREKLRRAAGAAVGGIGGGERAGFGQGSHSRPSLDRDAHRTARGRLRLLRGGESQTDAEADREEKVLRSLLIASLSPFARNNVRIFR